MSTNMISLIKDQLMMFVQIGQSITTFDTQNIRFNLTGITLVERKICCRQSKRRVTKRNAAVSIELLPLSRELKIERIKTLRYPYSRGSTQALQEKKAPTRRFTG